MYGHMQGIKTYLLGWENILGKFCCSRLHFRPLYENLNFGHFFHFSEKISSKNLFFEDVTYEVSSGSFLEGSMAHRTTLRVPRMFFRIWRTNGEQNILADCISGHVKKRSFWIIFLNFPSKTHILKKTIFMMVMVDIFCSQIWYLQAHWKYSR